MMANCLPSVRMDSEDIYQLLEDMTFSFLNKGKIPEIWEESMIALEGTRVERCPGLILTWEFHITLKIIQIKFY